MPQLSLRLLGPFEARLDGAPVTIASRKARALLAILATSPDLSVPRVRAQALLWGDRGEAQARASLRQELAGLRRVLGASAADCLSADAERVSLACGHVVSDVEGLLANGNPVAGLPARGAESFLEGLDLREAGFEDWARDTAATLSHRITTLARARLGAALRAGDWAAAEEAARCILREAPHDGAGLRGLMEALAGQGDRAAALRACDERIALAEVELGVAPETETETLALRARIAAAGAPAAPAATPALSEDLARDRVVLGRPAVLFLPFEALGQGEEDRVLAAGLCEEIRTTLACWRWFPVIGPEALGTNGAQGDIRSLAASVEASYAVTGSVRRWGERARVTARLIDGARGRELWSQVFDGHLADIFDFQEDVSRRIVAQIEPEIMRAAETRIAPSRPADLTVWELILKAADQERRGGPGYGTREANETQKRLLEEALARDPNSDEALSRMARCHWRDALMGWADDRMASIELALRESGRAVEINPENSSAHGIHAITRLFGKNDVEGARTHAAEATRLNPSNLFGRHAYGCVFGFAGMPEIGIPHLEAVFRLNPNYGAAAAVYADLMMCHALTGDMERAVEVARKVVSLAPNYARGLQRCASVFAHGGAMEEARATLASLATQGLDFTEDYVRETYPFRRSEDLEFLIAGLKKAGWTG